MAVNSPWYAGVCVGKHDLIFSIEVTSKLNDNVWEPVNNSKRLFPKTGQVELKSSDTRLNRIRTWHLFQVTKPSHSRGKSWQAVNSIHLSYYCDLYSELDLVGLRNLLCVSGISKIGEAGFWTFRFNSTQVIQVELHSHGNHLFISDSNIKIPVYNFEQEHTLNLTYDNQPVTLYKAQKKQTVTELLDWSSDLDYISYAVRTVPFAIKSEFESIVTSLEKHAKQAEDVLLLDEANMQAACDSVRSGLLYKRLKKNKDLLRYFLDAAIKDENIEQLIHSKIEDITNEERTAIRSILQTELDDEYHRLNVIMANKLKESYLVDEKSKQAELENEISEIWSESKKTLADVEQKKLQEIYNKYSEIENERINEIKNLHKTASILKNEVEEIERDLEFATQKLTDLVAEQSEKNMEIDRLLSIVSALKLQSSCSVDNLANAQVSLNYTPSVNVDCSEIGSTLSSCVLLTEEGVREMKIFLALMLSGDLPVLIGNRVNDFLLIAQKIISGGNSVKMFADPTMLTYEDLWIGTGAKTKTQLCLAKELTESESPHTVLASIEMIDLSGARFWYPALANKTASNNFSRRFLVCVTISDMDCEESQVILSQATKIDTSRALLAEASLIFSATPETIKVSEFDPFRGMVENSEFPFQHYANDLELSEVTRLSNAVRELSMFESNHETYDALCKKFLDLKNRKEIN